MDKIGIYSTLFLLLMNIKKGVSAMDIAKAKNEALQVAAMALKFIEDICEKD